MPVETPPRRPRKPCGMAPKDRARITSTLLVIASALSETYGRWPIRRGDGQRLEQSAHLRRRSEEHTSELQSLMRISYAVFCLKKKKTVSNTTTTKNTITT